MMPERVSRHARRYFEHSGGFTADPAEREPCRRNAFDGSPSVPWLVAPLRPQPAPARLLASCRPPERIQPGKGARPSGGEEKVMQIHEFQSRFVSRDERSVLFNALPRLIRMSDLKFLSMAGYAWPGWPPDGGPSAAEGRPLRA